MWLSDVVTLAIGTLVVLVVVHLAVFWVTQGMHSKPPTIVYVQQPVAHTAPPPTFTQAPEHVQTTYVPTLEPQVSLPPAESTRPT